MTVSMFCREQFHTGYAVRDVDRAIASLSTRLGISEWKIVRLPENSPGNALAFAHAGNMMMELVDVKPGQVPFYTDWIPEDPDVLQVHHHGFYVKDRFEFDAVTTQFEAQGFAMLTDADMPGILNYRYFDTTELLGHLTEFVLMQPGGESFFADVPRN
ncbi:MAG: VOC family protein [Novosphingobium sp.]|nr:VOC family protein [Novosphingobium sp.]